MAQGGRPEDEGLKRGGPAARASLGEWLRTQREARGVSLGEIVESTKISLRYLEAIEQDRYDALPAPIFVRGFLREYARVVGLDSDEVVNLYLISKPPAERAEELAPSPAPPANRSALVGYVVIVALLLGLFVGIAAGISYWFGREETSAVDETPGPSSGAPPAASSVAEPEPDPELGTSPRSAIDRVPGDPSEDAAPAPPPGSATATEPATTPSPATRTKSPAAVAPTVAIGVEAPEPPPAGPIRVVLDFQQDCWVEVTVDGRRRESELKAGGETLALEANESVLLTLGNAPAVRVEVDGRAIALPLAGSRVVRGLRIDRRGVAYPGRDPIDAGT